MHCIKQHCTALNSTALQFNKLQSISLIEHLHDLQEAQSQVLISGHLVL